MEYLAVAAVVALAWLLNLAASTRFKKNAKGKIVDYEKEFSSNGKNIFVYGVIGLGFLIIGTEMGGWIRYLLLGLSGLLALMSLLPLLIMFMTTIHKATRSDYSGINGSGKELDWLVFFSRFFDNASFLFIVYMMYKRFFL